MNDKCKYYNEHMETVLEYISCLYNLKDCCSGGLFHIMLDDDNIDDDDIIYCLKECLKHPEKEESKIGILICEEYLKMDMHERRCINWVRWCNNFSCIKNNKNCEQCEIHNLSLDISF